MTSGPGARILMGCATAVIAAAVITGIVLLGPPGAQRDRPPFIRAADQHNLGTRRWPPMLQSARECHPGSGYGALNFSPDGRDLASPAAGAFGKRIEIRIVEVMPVDGATGAFIAGHIFCLDPWPRHDLLRIYEPEGEIWRKLRPLLHQRVNGVVELHPALRSYPGNREV